MLSRLTAASQKRCCPYLVKNSAAATKTCCSYRVVLMAASRREVLRHSCCYVRWISFFFAKNCRYRRRRKISKRRIWEFLDCSVQQQQPPNKNKGLHFLKNNFWATVSVCPVCLSVCNVGALWPNGWMDQDATCTEVGLRLGHLVIDQDPASISPPRKGIAALHFLAHVHCGQTARWIKMPLDVEVSLGRGDVVLDGDTAPPRKGTQQPSAFRTMSIVAKRSPISATAELLFRFLGIFFQRRCWSLQP